MKIRRISFYIILLVGFFTSTTSCDGQRKSKKQKENTVEPGVRVPGIDQTIWAIYQDKDSNYWFGSKTNGVYFYNGQHLKTNHCKRRIGK